MKFKIPFSKGKQLDLSLKSHSYNDSNSFITTGNFVGFGGFSSNNENNQGLINTGYASNVTVYSIIKKIASNAADVPKILIDATNPDEVEMITDGEVFEMLQQPAIYQGRKLSQNDYFETVITYLLSTGDVYQRGLTSVGFGDLWQQLEILPSGFTTPITGNSYLDGARGYQFTDKQKTFNIPLEEVLHTKYINPSDKGLQSLEGLSPLQAALYSLTGSSDIQKAISIMVKNQGSRGILTNKGERPMDAEEAKQMKSSVNQKIRGIENFNSIHVTGTDVNYLNMGMNATDLKIIESGVLTDRQLCNAFSVPSVLFNDPANSTYNNYTTALKSLYTDAVLPVNNKILQDINNGWLAQYSLRDNKRYRIIQDTSSIEALQADQKEEADKDKANMEGVNTVLNMPITDEAKSRLLQITYGYTEEIANEIAQTNTTTNE